jgi:hypothetical protein
MPPMKGNFSPVLMLVAIVATSPACGPTRSTAQRHQALPVAPNHRNPLSLLCPS